MKRRFLAVILMLSLLLPAVLNVKASADVTDYIHYIPTKLVISSKEVEVEGYFVNLNESTRVGNFTDFSMEIGYAGETLIEADFGDLKQFMVPALGVLKHRFTISYPNGHNLTNGTYTCDDSYYAIISCSLQYR